MCFFFGRNELNKHKEDSEKDEMQMREDLNELDTKLKEMSDENQAGELEANSMTK